MTVIYLEPNILKTAGDTNSDISEHLYEMAYGESSGHVLRDVM